MAHFRPTCLALAAAILVGQVAPILAQTRERVHFAKGNDNAAVEGKITGNEYRDYLLGARKGQTMAVTIDASGSANFNILAPGSDGSAIFNSSIDGSFASVVLPSDGDYVIRVYLMGGDADGGRTVPFQLSMTIM
jgi:hypothetical protein